MCCFSWIISDFSYPYFHAFMLIIDLSDHLSDDAIDPLFFYSEANASICLNVKSELDQVAGVLTWLNEILTNLSAVQG